MNAQVIQNTIRFLALVFLQVTVFNNIAINGLFNPFVYVLFVLMLPSSTSHWVVVAMSFLIGLSVDVFLNTPGLHAGASAFMGYIRQFWLDILLKVENKSKVNAIATFDFSQFTVYASALIFMHHLWLFMAEWFRFGEIHLILLKVVLSTLLSCICVVVFRYLFQGKVYSND